jgi:alkanesulfonate monooxygenase SsuD/methylene tetrahydromethanopterin reductase-like flavin-dependent oxidoreductase (luciferase family)
MSRIQFGWTLPMPVLLQTAEQYNAQVRRGLDLITGHFDSAWFIDHLQDKDKPILEGWTTLTYLAALHPQLLFGHAVLCQSYRNPALLAKMAATFQYMSGGRLLFGIGAGYQEEEYTAYGYNFPSASIRIEELEEAILIIKSLWHNQTTTIEGKHHRVIEAYCEPKPNSFPPLIIGATRPRMLRVVAHYADWWSADRAAINDYRKQAEVCERACQELNRDPASLRRVWSGGCLCAPTEAYLKALNTTNRTWDYGFVGTPAQIVEQMQPFIDLGVDYFMLENGSFPDLTTLELLVSEVIPVLNR